MDFPAAGCYNKKAAEFLRCILLKKSRPDDMCVRPGHLQGNLSQRVCEAVKPRARFCGKFCPQGQTQRPRPVDETGSCVWRRAPIFTRGHRPPQGKLAKRKRNAVCLLQGRCDARCKSREPQSKEFLSRGCAQKWVPPKAFRFWTGKGGVRRA